MTNIGTSARASFVVLSDFNLFALDVDIDRPANWEIGLTTQEGRQLFRYLDIPKKAGARSYRFLGSASRTKRSQTISS